MNDSMRVDGALDAVDEGTIVPSPHGIDDEAVTAIARVEQPERAEEGPGGRER
ncbi:hypothetical protein [Salinirarus marinus]|uniref:hypothetical protein n=1 Tax=Salinirarus marinus TaxID=3068310 RepID=UPI003C6BE9F5